jgi:hypothetical protein
MPFVPILIATVVASLNANAVELNRRTFLGGVAAATAQTSPIAGQTIPDICGNGALESRVAGIKKVWISRHWFREFRNSPFDYSTIKLFEGKQLPPEITFDWPRYHRYKQWEGTQKWEEVSKGMDDRADLLVRYIANTELRLARQLKLPVEQIAEEVDQFLVGHLNWHDNPTLAPRKFAPLGGDFIEKFLAEIEADYPFMVEYARSCMGFFARQAAARLAVREPVKELSETEKTINVPEQIEIDQNLANVRLQIISLIRNKPEVCPELSMEPNP